MTQSGPLAGITVLDFSIWALGPLATVALADFGADVIKVEGPNGGDPGRGMQWTARSISYELPDGGNAYHEMFNRGKRGIVVDLKQPEGQAIVHRMVADVDVVIENFSPGVADRLGIGYDRLSDINPRLVYCSGSRGYGPKGPDSERPAMDYVGQARSGYMWSMGYEDDPPLLQTLGPGDMGGSVFLAQGILAGLVRRSITGEGCRVDASHVGAMMWIQYFSIASVLFTGADRWPRLLREEISNPLTNYYECADGEWIAIQLMKGDRSWKELCEAMNLADSLTDSRFATNDARRIHNRELHALLKRQFLSRSSVDWDAAFRQANLVFERVQSIADLARDEQILANEYLFKLDYGSLGERWLVRAPYHFNGEAPHSDRKAPQYGEHTWSVLSERFGYNEAELERLAIEGVIG